MTTLTFFGRSPEKFARLVYIDPPFNTGVVQKRERMRVTATDGPGDSPSD